MTHAPTPPSPSLIHRIVLAVVDWAQRRPFQVLALAICALCASLWYVRRLELRSDFLELLPRDSPGFIAYEHQLGRVGGGASLLVVAESPDAHANERFVDAVANTLERRLETERSCRAACKGQDVCVKACGPELVQYVERGTKDVQRYLERTKWLYVSVDELERVYDRLDTAIAQRSGLAVSFDDDEPAAPNDPKGAGSGSGGGAPTAKSDSLGLEALDARYAQERRKLDDFPSGYFSTRDERAHGLRIVTLTTGMGDAGGDVLLARMEALVKELNPSSFHPQMQVGFAGDIPNAVAEKAAVVSEAAWAFIVAMAVILGAIVVFYRSLWSLIIIALPVFVGIAAAYAFATFRFGYVNTSGAFLGAIILGNGINYPIVLLSRYQEFRARGQSPEQARRDAVWNAFRAELVGASVAAIAYGSLTITRFRGFSQFGTIGFVGMLLVWITMIPLVPAMLTLVERAQKWLAFDRIIASLPAGFRASLVPVREDGSHGPLTRGVSYVTGRWPWLFVLLAVVPTVFALVQLPRFLRDPWEYDFNNLGSRSSSQTGAARWSTKADDVFRGKNNIAGAMMLSDSPEQTPLIKQTILANDRRDPQGTLIEEVVTVDDLLPGTRQEQERKLEWLSRIRARLTPGVLSRLSAEERALVDRWMPPAELHVVAAKELPALLRRRFEEKDGTVGTVFYVKFRNDVVLSNGRNALRIAKTTDNIVLPDGTKVLTASRSTVFAEMIRSMERDGPLASFASLAAVAVVVLIATHDLVGAAAVLLCLILGVLWTVGLSAFFGLKLHFLNFIALPITFGIGSEYPFNVYDRARLLGFDVRGSVQRVGGAVALCSFTTIVGYGSLVLSDMQALQSFGRLAVAGEVACLLAAMLLLPSMLHLILRSRWAPRPSLGAHETKPADPIR